MRPVRGDEAEDLAKWKPMMILDKTLYGPAYVESLVARDPGLVTSKTSVRKTLPLEIWYIILDIITDDPSLHDFAIVRANCIEIGGKRGRVLVCNRVNQWASLGALRDEHEVEEANKYLARPDLTFRLLPNPFHLDGASQPWEIPSLLFSSKIKCLHVEITVPDFIKHFEDGNCHCCSNTRTIHRQIYKTIGGLQEFQRVTWSMFMPVMCPVCVGLEAFERCTVVFGRSKAGAYLAWLKEELMKLLESEEPFNECLAENIRITFRMLL
ncbi:uncharacterized protein FIESC28_05084 [Fusarium coffeatum]|uniref:Uncharacterized protein n=1 Tax=Fusarium coffeatum TaxID=231269 RepID=A0A366RVU7_9HYPO|nr:uncharacterized protein FIESC28_05084 [Fusarium coffeatum]RBR20932.1 hypothetical protein FIESC28_05084 [Fusarium coffeatum]